MNFHDTRLPQYIEICAIGSSEFATSTVISMSGREARNSDSQSPKRRYKLTNCFLSASQFETFNSFFQARAGKRFSFRFRDSFDCKVDKQIIATSDGINNEFQLQKIYADAVSPYIRVITKPIIESVKILVDDKLLKVDNIDANSGKVKLEQIIAKTSIIYASFTFDVPVRFVNDNFQYSFNPDGSIKLDDVELIEVYE